MLTEVSPFLLMLLFVFAACCTFLLSHLFSSICSCSSHTIVTTTSSSLTFCFFCAVSGLRDAPALVPFKTKTMRLCSLRRKAEGWYCLLRRCARQTAHGWQPVCGNNLIGALRHFLSEQHAAFIRTSGSSGAPSNWAVWDPTTTTYAEKAHLLGPTQI